jgi:pimeloyl-ACP methyl ester carboxylesterase
MHGWREDIAENARRLETSGEALLYIFFAHTETSQAKGMEFLGRFMARTEDRDPPTSLALRDGAVRRDRRVGNPRPRRARATDRDQLPDADRPGRRDLMIPTKLSHLMAGLIPDAQIRIYPDSAHAFLFQEPEQVAADVNAFPDQRAGRRGRQPVPVH